MIVAVSTMSPGVQAVLYAVAIVLFVVGAIAARLESERNIGALEAVAVGLAVALVPAFWNAPAAS